MNEEYIEEAVKLLKNSSHTTAFTGAGISVESGIPPFRGKNGLWNEYDPLLLDINYFYQHPEESWELNRDVFYKVFAQAEPNKAHKVLAAMEQQEILQAIITQNIDNLHQEAGSKEVYEFHGNSRRLVCTGCGRKKSFDPSIFTDLPPFCERCGEVLKPDYVFFGEPIPEPARSKSFREAKLADVFLVIGTEGEVQPAAIIPLQASKNGAKIIEVNTGESNYTNNITDIYLQGKATEIMGKIGELLM